MHPDRRAGLEAIFADRLRIIEEDRRLVEDSLPAPGRLRHAGTLAKREVLVLKMIGLGMKNREIAEALNIGPNTVRTYTKRIHDKTAIEGRGRLMAALARGV